MLNAHRYPHSIRHYLAQLANAKRLGIQPTDLVLDLASGQDPQPRANVLCDKFLVDTTERSCNAGLVVDRAFVVADATQTPFPNHAFDFVYCSHLLEHMQEPHRLLQEIQRIGRRGYIETPSKIYEKLWGWRFHRWFVSVEGRRLVIESKDRVIFDDDLHDWFSAHIEREPMWAFFMSRLHELELLTVLVWDGEIAYEIRGQASPDSAPFVQAHLQADFLLEKTAAALTLAPSSGAQKTKSSLSRWIRRRSDGRVRELMNALVCPRCRGGLRSGPKCWWCAACRVEYPVVHRVPVMLPEICGGGTQPPGESVPAAAI